MKGSEITVPKGCINLQELFIFCVLVAYILSFETHAAESLLIFILCDCYLIFWTVSISKLGLHGCIISPLSATDHDTEEVHANR